MDESWPKAPRLEPTLVSDASPLESPALRDAADIVRRAADDEAAATEARERYRTEAQPRLESDERLSKLLEPDEWLLAVRKTAILDRRAPREGETSRAGLGGQLAVTSRRLILAGRQVLTFDLGDIEDILLSGDRLMVTIRGGSGMVLDVEQPRLLRVEIAAARAAARN